MDILNEYMKIMIFIFLDDMSKLSLALTSRKFFNIFKNSIKLLNTFKLNIDCKNFKDISTNQVLYDVNFVNISLTYDSSMNKTEIIVFLNRYKDCIENLELKFFKFESYNECFDMLTHLGKLNSLKLNECSLRNLKNEALVPICSLRTLSFEKCDENIFKIFTKQNTIEKIIVSNDNWTWNGFAHNEFNKICQNCSNLTHIVLNGAGTASYFDCDEFPYQIKILETTMITFHWYVGITTARTSFLESQKGSLKELKIHQLPFDFDGGRVLKYLIEEMHLDSFYYGDVPLILNGIKQDVKEFFATETQLTSAYEMIRQFPGLKKFVLKLLNTDVSSDAIENVINPRTSILQNIKEFEIIDMSGYRGLFGLFLGLLKNLTGIERLSIQTQDRNINVILGECLPVMRHLNEIYLTSNAPRSLERLNIIRNYVPYLKKITLSSQFVEEAEQFFENHNVIISAIEC